MPRFDVYRNPNPRATHALFLDVQSDLVRTSTRWCVPLLLVSEGMPVLSRAQQRLNVGGQVWFLDTPNILAVPAVLLRVHVGRLDGDEQLLVEAAIEFMLRGY
jgi:CcdB protein